MQNPAMAQMLAQNPDALAQLLGVELDEEVPPGTHVVSVTVEERAAIERVCDFFFLLVVMIVEVFFFFAVGSTWVSSPSGAGGLLCL